MTDCWADRNLKLTVVAFSLRFKCFKSMAYSSVYDAVCLVRYSIAVPDERVQSRPSCTLPINPHPVRRKVACRFCDAQRSEPRS